MYPPFEVFFFSPEKTECKTKVYTFLPRWEQVRLHNVLIAPSGRKGRRKTCVGPVSVKGRQPHPGSYYDAEGE